MRELEEIVDDILVELHPLKDAELDLKQSLRGTVASLRKFVPLWRKISLTKKRAPARQLSSAIAKLEKCLRQAPGILISPMFADFDRFPTKTNIEDIQSEIEVPITRFNLQLQKMRIKCESAARVPDRRSSHEKKNARK